MKIQIHGGLGNQLFQYAFYHFYKVEKKSTKIYLIPNPNERNDRSYNLQRLTHLCQHQNGELDFQKLHVNLIKYHFNNMLMKIDMYKRHMYKEELNQFRFDEKLVRQIHDRMTIRGYFQHWKYVNKVFHLIKPELANLFETLKLSSNDFPREYVGIHVRRGDNKYSLQTMGTLSSNYYRQIIRIHNLNELPAVIFTDDVEGASDVIDILKPDLIIGPNDFSEWEALYLMSKSQSLITANSTYSWWAGYIGKNLGYTKKVFVPWPWFRKWPVPISDSFLFPDAIKCTSEFVDDFETQYLIN